MHTLELPCADQFVGDNGRGAVTAQAVLAAPVKQAHGENHGDEQMGFSGQVPGQQLWCLLTTETVTFTKH